MIAALRAALILAAFFTLTLPLMPVQALLLRLGLRGRRPVVRHFPNWYHRQLCRLLGIRLHIDGALQSGVPVLLIANHVSWLDIPVLSALAPVSFVAKREVSTWPMVRTLARLQRTVFVDRQKRLTVGVTAREIEKRLGQGDAIVLFAEGTSSDGGQVLPFRSALIAAAGMVERRKAATSGNGQADTVLDVRTLSLAYTHLHGLPLDRSQRAGVAWYGDMELTSHVWALLKNGPLDVHIRIGAPLPLDALTDRKALARHSEHEVRRAVAQLLRGSGPAKNSAET
jgi:lyso-ornithine lipid O-acyltransferase